MRGVLAVVRRGVAASLIATFATHAAGQANPSFERGERFRHEELGLACWIPRGLGSFDAEGFDASYQGHAPIRCSLAIRTSNLALDAFKESASKQEAYAESFDGRIGGRRVHVFCAHNDGAERREGGYPAASALVECGDGLLVFRVLVHDEASQTAACGMLRWIVGTLRVDGAAGLDACLERRTLDRATGLCYRTPRGFTADPTPADGAIWSGSSTEPRLRVRIASSAADSIRAALGAATEGTKRCGRGWLLPVPEPKRDVLATERRFDDGAGEWRAVFVVAEFGARRFVVRVDGPREARDAVANVAESVAWGLDCFEVAAALERIAAAAATLADGGSGGAAETAANTLGAHALFEEARAAIAAHVVAVDDGAACAMLRGLARDGAADASCAAALVKAARVFSSRKRIAPLDAALRALGTVRSVGGARVLVKHLRRVTPGTLVAALDALARYRVQRATILKAVVAAYEAESRAGRAGSYEAAERLRRVEPAFRRTLLALTGQRLMTVDDASAWWRANRRTIRN